MQLLPRFAQLSLPVSPAALAEQPYRVDIALSRQMPPVLASQPVPDDRTAGSMRLDGSQRLLLALGEAAGKLIPANGCSIETGNLTHLAQHGRGWLSEPSAP